MACSYSYFKLVIKDYIKNNWKNIHTILDIGPGQGTYFDLLKDTLINTEWTGVEAFLPNIEKYNLKDKYNNIYNEDIVNFNINKQYDLIIMGDVLEHLTIEDAQSVLSKISKYGKHILIAVPYKLEQDAIDNNIYEIHKQDDLTKEVMEKRYPDLKFLIGNDEYGYYVKKEENDFEKTMLSVIIPCYNLENWIKKCIDSLLIQNNKENYHRELIFICDNCTDHTKDIILYETKNCTNWDVKILDAKQGCAGGARNVGLDIATGKYIWFIDGDDWIVGENSVDTILECMLRDDMDIVQFKIRSNANPQGIFGDGTVWQAMFSSRLIGNYRFNDRQTGEDNDFCDEMWNHRNPKMGKIALAPYFYNFPRENSLSDIAYNWWSNKKQTIVLSCTRNYYQYLYTWLYAYTRNNYYKNLYLFIEDDELNLPFINIKYININKLNCLNEDGKNYNTGYSKASLIRLYLADLLSEDTVLYIDIDTIVKDNIDELFDLDLTNYYAAGVIDEGAKTNLMTPNIEINKNKYFNSGVLLLNLKKIREDNKIKELDEYVNTHNLFYPDQDTINVIFKDKILSIDSKYNSSIFTKPTNDFKIYHWAGGKENWVYDRENSNYWKDAESHSDPDFKLKVINND